MKVVLNRQQLYLEMNQSLNRKYQYLFHFYQVKWVNDLLDASRDNQTYQKFIDMRTDIEDVEFMKRMYYYKTPTGKLEIDNRIRLCIGIHPTIKEFYSNRKGFMYEYPMMIVTNTKSLFVRRNKRMKKIQAGEGSSDETEQNPNKSNQQEQNSSNYLEQLSRSNIQQESLEQSLSLSYQSQPHCIYNQYNQNQEKSFYRIPKTNQVSEALITHLIIQIPVTSQVKIDSDLPSFSKNTLNSIENHPRSIKESTISVIPIQQKQSIANKERKAGVLSSYLDLIIDKQMNYAGLGFKFDNPAVNQYNKIDVRKSSAESIQKEREQRASRRQRIREKAQQLLKKVSREQQQQDKSKL